MTRLRASGSPPRPTSSTSLQRTFWLPTARTFSLTGQARISPLVPDDEIDRLVGRPGSDYTGTVAYSEGRLPNDLRANAMATLDDDPSTVWEPGFGAPTRPASGCSTTSPGPSPSTTSTSRSWPTGGTRSPPR